MIPEEIKSALTCNTGTFPLDAMSEAIAQREAITPILLAELERMAEHPQALVDEPDSYMLHIFAMYLLAQFREHRALAPLVRICHLPQEDLEFLLEDVITEGLPSILASVCGGDAAPIKTIIENQELDEFTLGAGISALMTMAAEGTLAREELIEYLRGLFRTLPPESPLWNICIYAADAIYPEELLPEIRAAYDADLVDRTWISMNDIERTMGEGRDATLAQLRRSHHYVTDAIRTLENWACFRGEDDNDAYAPIEDNWHFPQMPYVLETPKIGRNDPCPRGSGKRYKKCCMPV